METFSNLLTEFLKLVIERIEKRKWFFSMITVILLVFGAFILYFLINSEIEMIVLSFLMFSLIILIPFLSFSMNRLSARLETRQIEKGRRGVLATLTLYRERVINNLTTPTPLGSLGHFNLEKMYIPLALEFCLNDSGKVNFQQPQELLRNYPRLIILGPPGAGKTTMLRFMELLSARGRMPGLPDIPIFIPLCQILKYKSIFDAISGFVFDKYNIHITTKEVLRLLHTGLVMLLLDGLDEVGFKNEQYDAILQDIKQLATKFPKSPILLTSRTAAWEKEIDGFFETSIQSLSTDSIRGFIVSRLHSESADYIERLYNIILNNKSISNLVITPLFLSLVISIYQKEKRIPRNRFQLYQQCTDLLLYRWDEIRGINRKVIVPQQLKYQLLKLLASFLHKNNATVIHQSDLLNLISDWFPKDLFSSPNDILQELEIASGILVRESPDFIRFVHISFQEYFAALNISDEKLLPEILFDNIYTPWWKEIVLLLSSQGRTGEIVEFIIKDTAHSPDISKLSLAASCIRSSDTVSERSRMLVIKELITIFTQNEGEVVYDACIALSMIGGNYVTAFFENTLNEYNITSDHNIAASLALSDLSIRSKETYKNVTETLLFSLSNENEHIKRRAVQSLGKLKDPLSLNPLLTALKNESSDFIRLDILRSINRIERSDVDTSTSAVIIQTLKELRFDENVEVANLATEIINRFSILPF